MATEVTKTIKPSGGDYTSLSGWEAGEQGDLTGVRDEIAIAECYAMSDTTVVVIDGWITSATQYIKIYTPASDRHDGKWNSNKYRLEISGRYDLPLYIAEGYTRIEGLQVARTNAFSNDNYILEVYTATDVRISNSLIKDTGTTGGSYLGVYVYNSANFKLWNSIIYDVNKGIYTIYGDAGNIFNVTIVNVNTGVQHNYVGTTLYCKNVLCKVATGGVCFVNDSGTLDLNYCASSDATADDFGGTGNRVNQTFTFVDEENDNFHLASNDAGAKDYGVSDPGSGLFSDDIDGVTRSGTWDIGADEYVAAGGTILPQMLQHHGG